MGKRVKVIAALVVLVLAVAGLYYYIVLPPINIHAPGFWWFIIFVLAVAAICSLLFGLEELDRREKYTKRGRKRERKQSYELKYKS